MKIYYIKEGKCINVVEKVLHASKYMCYAVPFIFTGESLFQAYMRMYHNDISKVCGKVLSEYVVFGADTINLSMHYFLGDISSTNFYSDAMNILLSNIR